MSTTAQPQAACLRQRAVVAGDDAHGLVSGKEKASGNASAAGIADSALPISTFDLGPAPPLRPRALSKILSGYLTLAVVYAFSAYFAATVGLSMLMADFRKRGRGSSSSSDGGGGGGSSSSPSSAAAAARPPLLPDPETQREAAVAAEPGIEGVAVTHDFITVPVFPDEADGGSTSSSGGNGSIPEATTTALHLARAGVDPSRRAVLFLHGFPECWLSWRGMMKPLVEAGYEVAALDMRGYNLSGKPGGKENSSKFLPASSKSLAAFDVGALAADARAAAVYLSGPRKRMVTLVSHDWGGLVAWYAASVDSAAARGGNGKGGEKRENDDKSSPSTPALRPTPPPPPRLFDALVTMAIPHPLLCQENMGWRQAKRSWYVAFFQSPFFPEKMMAGDGAASIRATLPWSTEKDRKQADEIADAFTREGAATATINYYRASVRAVGRGPLSRAGARASRSLRGGVDVPVLSLYAGRDSALGLELLAGTARFCHAGVEIRVLDSGHRIQLEKSEECAEGMLRFLERTGGNAAKISG